MQYVPGGATQNSIRFAQWMLQVPGATTYFGSVGADEYADTMKAAAEAAGVKARAFARIVGCCTHAVRVCA